MNTRSYSTHFVTNGEVQRNWYIVDAEGQTVGRMASRIAAVLRGKHRPEYTPNADCGDFVIVINASKARLTGNKMNDKLYKSYSGYPGGQSLTPAKDLLAKHPTAIVELAIKGMMPKNKLGRAMFKKLHVFAGSEHNHQAQKPQPLTF